MPMALTIYHNPRCSKSRKTLELIENAKEPVNIVRYLSDPPSADRLVELAGMLGIPISAMLRTGEATYREAEDLPALDDDGALAAWLARHPVVIERPIVVDDSTGRAVIGRPPENVTALFSQ